MGDCAKSGSIRRSASRTPTTRYAHHKGAFRRVGSKAATAGPPKPRNLPFASLGTLFAGRDEDLAELHNALLGAKGAPVALHGLGAIGKTRLAIEYAWSREAVYSALLFVSASDGAALNAGLAGLTAFEILDLPEKEARDDATKITAVLRWLESNPTWLMILDNVDDRAAVAEVAKLMPRFKGGHVVVTARASNFPAGVRKLELSTLDEDAAAQFLLDRTEADRSKSKDDTGAGADVGAGTWRPPLGLEQAGAHISTDRIGFARYLRLWSHSREKALAWADATVTGSDRTLATTWATSVARLAEESRRLLDRLAFLALTRFRIRSSTSPFPARHRITDAYESRAGLHAYSLISPVTAEDGGTPAFVVHRLVQDFARRAMSEERRAQALREALRMGERSLRRQSRRRAELACPRSARATRARGRAPCGCRGDRGVGRRRLFNGLGVLFSAKADYAQAEPLICRALAIDEKSHGPDHPIVAIRLNNLAQLLQDTNRLAKAEPLMRRALAIDETKRWRKSSRCRDRPQQSGAVVKATNRLAEAEPLMRRALAIDREGLRPIILM